MSSKNLLSLANVFGPRRKPARNARRDRSRGAELHSGQIERLEERLALTLDVHAVPISSGHALLVLLDGPQEAYVTRQQADILVADNSSYQNYAITNSQEVGIDFNGVTIVGDITGTTTTVFVSSGREIRHFPFQAYGPAGDVTFNVWAGYTGASPRGSVIPGSLRGQVTTTWGNLAYEMSDIDQFRSDLTITLGPYAGPAGQAWPAVTGEVFQQSGFVRFRFRDGDTPRPTSLTTGVTHFATFQQSQFGPQTLTVTPGFDIDARFLAQLVNDESRLKIQSPVLASRGGVGDGFYANFGNDAAGGGGISLGAEYININAPVSGTGVAVGFAAGSFVQPGVQARVVDVQRPLSASVFYNITVGGLDANADGRIQQNERGIFQTGAQGRLGDSIGLNISATDADVVFGTTVNSQAHSYFFNSVNDTQQWQFTTRSPDTGLNVGKVIGNTVGINFGTAGGTASTVSAANPHVVSLNTQIDSLRMTAAGTGAEAVAFPVRVDIADQGALSLDATPASSAPMSFRAESTLTTTAEIRTFADLALTAGTSLVANGAVTTVIGNIAITAPLVTGGAAITAGSGLVKRDVRVATSGPIPAASWLNGVFTGPGGTFFPALTVDGVQIGFGDRVLVKDEPNQERNGIYRVTTPITSISPSQMVAATAAPLAAPNARLATTVALGTNTLFTPATNTISNVIAAGAGLHDYVLNVDGTTAFTAGDLILVKDQATASQNGLYSVAVAPNMTRQLADVRLATAAALPAATYANGTAGVGATLTAAAPALLLVDGVAVNVGDRILVKDQPIANAAQNGVYVVTVAGTNPVGGVGGTAWVLTRAVDADQSAELVAGVGVHVTAGGTNNAAAFVLGAAVPTVGTSPVNFNTPARIWSLTRAAEANSVAEVQRFTSVRVTGGAVNSGLRFQQQNVVATLNTSPLQYVENYSTLSGSSLGPGGLPQIDGRTINQFEEVLIKDQADNRDNGVYFLRINDTVNGVWVLERSPTAFPLQGIGFNVLNGTNTGTWYVSAGPTSSAGVGRQGITFASAAGTTWTLARSEDADLADELPLGTTANVLLGTANGDTAWSLTTPAPFTLNTTNLVFAQTRKRDAFAASAAPLDGTYDTATNRIDGRDSSLILTIDGVQFLQGGPAGVRVLVKDQTNAAENGIYEVTTRSNVIRQLADVRAATTAALAATYRNNTPGVIASTLIGTGLLPLIDGIELAAGDRVLVQNQASALENGVYVVTRMGGESGDYLVNGGNRDWVLTRAADMDAAPEFTVGTGVFVRESVTTPGGFGRQLATLSATGVVVGTTQVTFGGVTRWRLTRSADADTAGELPYGVYVKVTNGATNAQTGWALGTDDPVTLGTTPLDFYTANSAFVKGNGNLAITSATGNLTVNSLVSATGDTVRLTASGATAAIGGTSRIAADRAELVAGGAISATGSVTTLVATSGAGVTFDNSGALELEAVQTATGNINVSAGGRITATAVRAGGGANGPTTPTGAFDIDLVFGPGLPSAVQAAMRSAADRWEQIIVGDIADFTDPVSGQLIDDIRVNVQAGLLGGPPSDGPGNALANAGPTGLRPAGSTNQFLPYTAQVGIDTADYTQSEIVGIMIHELGHALGFTETAERLNLVSSAYVWTGANATREYRSLVQPGATGVPMETDTTQFGPGSLYAHWSEQVLGNELMTPAIGNPPNPLSRITVGAFEDMGYAVNYAAADAYPSSASVRPAAAVAGDGNISLTARAGNIDVVALTAEQDKVTLSAANGTIAGLAPAAAWLDWTAKVAPQQAFYNDFQKLSANLTGAGSIVVNNPGAVTLQDVRTADGNILVTAGGTLTPVSVVAGGRGTVYLDYAGVGGTLAAGTITSNAASPRVLRKDPVRVATTADIALVGLQTIDGVALAANDRVLVRNQANPAQNGVYVVVAAGNWTRALDADQAEDLPVGLRVAVTEGTQRGDYECVRGSSLTLGATPLAFERLKILGIVEVAPVRLATTAPIAALATTGVVDGVALAFGDRVLVRRQADAAENGIYSFSGTGLVRTADALTHGAFVTVTSGTQAGGYMLTFAGQTATAGATPLRFEPVAVAVTSSTSITDGSVGADTVDITAGTVRLVARDGSIGTVTNRLDIAADVLVASASASGLASLTSGANIYVGDTGDLVIANAFAGGRVDVAAGGISGKLSADKVETNAAGTVTLTAPGDITVGTIGSADPGRRTALVTLDAATGFLRNSADGTAVTADKVRLVSRNFANFDFGRLDDVNVFSVKQTSAGVLQSTFNRVTPVTFDDVTTSGGDVAFTNAGTGDFLIGAGGINAGAFNGVSLATGGQIGGPLAGNQGKIAGGGVVSLTADATIFALTSAGSLAAKITGTTAPGTITITETDSAQIGATGIDAGGVGSLINLTAGGQLDGLGTTSGVVKGDAATVTARTGIGLKTELGSLAASTASGVIVVRENDDLTVAAAGITATLGNVSISTGESATATAGSLSYDRSSATSGLITGGLVTLDARKPGFIDVSTKATEIAGSTVAGSFTVVEADGVAVGRAGVSAGRTARAATDSPLTATYVNNTPGLLPATLTGSGVLVVDGVTLAIGDLVLVKNQSAALQNGIYVVTAAGSPTTAWRLTRAADADTDAELPNGTIVNVSEGRLGGGRSFQVAIAGALGTADLLVLGPVAAPGTDIVLSTTKGDIQTPTSYAATEGRLAGDIVTITAAGSVTARTDARALEASAGGGSVTIAERSAVELTRLYSSTLSGSGSVSVTAGGTMQATDVRARGTKGTVSLTTTFGDVQTVPGASLIAPELLTITAQGRISAKDAGGTPLQAPAITLKASGIDGVAAPAIDAEVATKTLSASAPNGSVKVVVESTDTLVLGAAATGSAPQASLTAAGSVDISSSGGDVVVFAAPQARAPARVVRVAATTNLPATLVGSTLTATAPGSLNNPGIDGVTTLRVGDRVLLTGQIAPAQRGIYVVTSLGSGTSAWTLTRAADADTPEEYPVGSLTRVTEGIVNAGRVFNLTAGAVGSLVLTFADVTATLTTRISTADATKAVSYVVSATSGTNTSNGTLGNMLDLAQGNAAAPANAALVFSTTLTAPIFLTQELPVVTRPLVIDGRQRLSPTTLARSTSTALVSVNGTAITFARNGSQLATTAAVDGFTVDPGAGNTGATIAGLALGGFTKGSAVRIVSGTGAVVRNSTFGLTSTNTKVANQTGVTISGGQGATLFGNTIGWSTAAGVQVTGGTGTTIRGNFIGTNAAGSLKFGNAGSGISATGGTGTLIAGNTIANTTGSGVTVDGVTTAVTIGSLTATDRNVISANSRHGVEVLRNAFASIVGSRISANTLGGISSPASVSGTLAAPGINNTATSKPTLQTSGGTTTLTLSGTVAGSGQRFVDLYASSATSTGNQAEVYLGRITIASGTTFSGSVSFASSLGVTGGWKITATVTAAGTGGNLVTSAFSTAVAAVTGGSTGGGTTSGGGGSPGMVSRPRPASRP